MTVRQRDIQQNLKLYITPEHDCSYLDGNRSRTLFADPHAQKDAWLYQYLIDQGFRRSGDMIYRPHCENCQACVPVRIPVQQFSPDRSQRRVWRNDQARFHAEIRPAQFDAGHYRLYQRYIQSRHPDGEMADTTVEKYLDFLTCSWNEPLFMEFRTSDSLAAVAVTDRLPNGLSAVYTFFDPCLSRHSPGVYALLWQIDYCRRLDLPWLYLGYWIPGCRKMEYKTRYHPIQIYHNAAWQPYEASEQLTLAALSQQ